MGKGASAGADIDILALARTMGLPVANVSPGSKKDDPVSKGSDFAAASTSRPVVLSLVPSEVNKVQVVLVTSRS